MPKVISQEKFAKEIGSRVRLRREQLEMTRTILAKKSGLHEWTIIQVEHGRQIPGVYNLYLVAKALGCDTDDLHP